MKRGDHGRCVPSREEGAVVPSPLTAVEAAALRADDVLARLGSGAPGLTEDEAARRLRVVGPNAVRSHRVHALSVLASQLRSPLLILLAVTALASAFLGQVSDAVIIGVILAASVGLGFVNEYKAAKTAEALHSSVRHSCVTLRGGHPRTVDVTELVPGDVVDLQLGQVVPADLRLLAVAGLECDESVLTGESVPAEKSAEPVAAGTPLAELGSCALMGTAGRVGRRRGGRDRRRRGVRPDRRGPGRAAAGDRVPGRAAEVLDAARPGGRGADRSDLRYQRRAAQAGDRRAAVLAVDRGRDLAAAAPGGRVDQPGRRVAAAGPAQGPGQAAAASRTWATSTCCSPTRPAR